VAIWSFFGIGTTGNRFVQRTTVAMRKNGTINMTKVIDYHGEVRGYTYYKCRCNLCKKAGSIHNAAAWKKHYEKYNSESYKLKIYVNELKFNLDKIRVRIALRDCKNVTPSNNLTKNTNLNCP
jgi:hypothetical protein